MGQPGGRYAEEQKTGGQPQRGEDLELSLPLVSLDERGSLILADRPPLLRGLEERRRQEPAPGEKAEQQDRNIKQNAEPVPADDVQEPADGIGLGRRRIARPMDRQHYDIQGAATHRNRASPASGNPDRQYCPQRLVSVR